jgi:lysozyme
MNIKFLTEQLTRHEGKRSKLYKDTVGKWTIGIGRNLDDVGLYDDEINLMLSNDIRRHYKDLLIYLPWVEKLSEIRQNVLTNMCFNMGIGNQQKGLLSFRNTLDAIQIGDYFRASEMMLASKWAKQVGQRAVELAKQMANGADMTVYDIHEPIKVEPVPDIFIPVPVSRQEAKSEGSQGSPLFNVIAEVAVFFFNKFKKG